MSEVILNCKYHGACSIEQVIKCRKDKDGNQKYRCKACMKIMHKNHYQKNKEKVREHVANYRKENILKVRETRNRSKKKHREKNREKNKKRAAEYRIAHKEQVKARDKRYRHNSIREITDAYIRRLYFRGKQEYEILKELADLFRISLLLKRERKVKKHEQNK